MFPHRNGKGHCIRPNQIFGVCKRRKQTFKYWNLHFFSTPSTGNSFWRTFSKKAFVLTVEPPKSSLDQCLEFANAPMNDGDLEMPASAQTIQTIAYAPIMHSTLELLRGMTARTAGSRPPWQAALLTYHCHSCVLLLRIWVSYRTTVLDVLHRCPQIVHSCLQEASTLRIVLCGHYHCRLPPWQHPQ